MKFNIFTFESLHFSLIFNFSIFCDFVCVTFSICHFVLPFGLQVWTLGAPMCPPWLPSAPLWALIWSLLAPFGSPLVPFGSLLTPSGSFWLRFGSAWLPFGSIWLHLASLWVCTGPLWFPWPRFGSLLAMQRLCNEGTIRYIYNHFNKTHIHVCS